MKFLPLLVLVLLVAVVLMLGNRFSRSRYARRQALLDVTEREFFANLEAAFSDKYRIFPQIRMADVVQPEHGRSLRQWWKALQRIANKRFDFVICTPSKLAIVAVIQLEESFGKGKRAARSKRFVEQVCRSIQLPLLSLSVKKIYKGDELLRLIERVQNDDLSQSQLIKVLPEGKEDAPDSRYCPECESPMVLRRSKSGKHKGEEFWGCSRFPVCRGMRLIA